MIIVSAQQVFDSYLKEIDKQIKETVNKLNVLRGIDVNDNQDK